MLRVNVAETASSNRSNARHNSRDKSEANHNRRAVVLEVAMHAADGQVGENKSIITCIAIYT